MKKILLIGAPVGLTVLLLAAYSFGSGGFGHGGHRGMMKDFMLWKLEQVEKDLNLNPAQQAKWDAFQRDLASNIEDRMGKRSDIHEAVKSELEKGNPDINKVTGIIHSRIDDHAQFAHQMVDRIAELYSDLTPEQRKLLISKIEAMHDRED